ncbi:MAG: FkbM family methyltransferase, partial [Deltaproteobacteria bacterium]|nr:FkbM family methyltransferase [Deltaproteobacteria bacterium]
MASVNSPIRKFVKPLLYKLLGERGYFWFQYYGKLRDIEKRLVEEPEMELLPQLLTADSVSLDIGANYAYYTVRLAQLCPQGRVHAFEPIPGTYEICKKLVEHYGFRNVELFQKGVGAKNEKIEFEVPLQDMGTISAGQAHIKGRNNDMEGKEKYHAFAKHRTF